MRFTLTSHQALSGAINVLANMTFSRTDPFLFGLPEGEAPGIWFRGRRAGPGVWR